MQLPQLPHLCLQMPNSVPDDDCDRKTKCFTYTVVTGIVATIALWILLGIAKD